MRSPSARSRSVSKCSIRCPAFRLAMIWSSSAMRSGGITSEMCRPTASRGGVAEQPFGRGVPALNHAVERLADDGVVRRFDDRREQPGRSSWLALSRSEPPLLVTSRKISTQPDTRPRSSRIGAALSSIGRSAPSLRISRVWFARPTTTPSRSARAAGLSTGWRVSSLMIRNTVSSGWPGPPHAPSPSGLRPPR